MNRTIKFRAWDKVHNKMVTPIALGFLSNEVVTSDSALEIGKHCELMQYTGLKDRMNKEIYEGDIVKWGHLRGSREVEVRIATVKIDPDIQFDCRNINLPHVFHYGRFAYSSNQLEVIGNIYQHQNLLQP